MKNIWKSHSLPSSKSGGAGHTTEESDSIPGGLSRHHGEELCNAKFFDRGWNTVIFYYTPSIYWTNNQFPFLDGFEAYPEYHRYNFAHVYPQ